jgi:hypothetical protein
MISFFWLPFHESLPGDDDNTCYLDAHTKTSKLECVVFEASVVTLKQMRGMRVEIKRSQNLNLGWDEVLRWKACQRQLKVIGFSHLFTNCI